MIYLIKKMWLDPMENRDAIGYREVGYVTALDEAEAIVDGSKFMDKKECWALEYLPPQKEYEFEVVLPFLPEERK